MVTFPLELEAFEVNQPLGTFYLTKVTPDLLRQVSFSIPLRFDDKDSEVVEFVGAQREKKERRIREIGKFIDTVECAFPNTIILAANYDKEGNHIIDDRSWFVKKENDDSSLVKIVIPTREKLASLVDGQHRLDGFNQIEISSRLEDVELPISVYLDLPVPYQAYIFATINHNQQPVSKSLSYILYGFNLENESSEAWAPEKLAVFQSRKLNSDDDSLFYRKIKVAPQVDKELINKKFGWTVSTATIVDGILALITKNARRDRDEIGKVSVEDGRNRKQLEIFSDDSPLRKYYLANQDIVIYKSVFNFFNAVGDLFFPESENEVIEVGNSSLMKTIGLQALFDVLKENLSRQTSEIKENYADLDIREDYFKSLLSKFTKVNFEDGFFPVASAAGRSKIRNFLLYGLGYRDEFDENGKRILKEQDVVEFKKRLE